MKAVIVNICIIAVVLLILGAIIFYLVKAKKRGETCVGCPYAKQCAKKCASYHKKNI